MARKRATKTTSDQDEIVALRLPIAEREVIMTSAHLAEAGILERVRNAPPRQPVAFDFDELEDLHRGLAFESEQTLDTKRRKIISRVLRKIEELLDEEDLAESEPWGEEWDDEPALPASPDDLFDSLFGAALSVPAAETLPVCRVKLTASEREVLRAMETLSLDIHKLLAVDTSDEFEIELNPRQFLVMSLAIKEAINQCENETAARPYREVGRQISAGLFAALAASAEKDRESRYRSSQSSPVKLAYQLKITLEHSKPAIWRSVLVGDCTLDVLHEIIQAAMGWTDSHLHLFQYGDDIFSDPRSEVDEAEYDETQVRISDLVANGCKKLRYCYDFGDDWWHTVAIEKSFKPKPTDGFPKCVKGAGARPPEDIGGIWGYYELLDAIRNPKHERHAELVEWLGDDFDPNAFNVEQTNAALARGPFDLLEDERMSAESDG
jgi:hypothetical protein